MDLDDSLQSESEQHSPSSSEERSSCWLVRKLPKALSILGSAFRLRDSDLPDTMVESNVACSCKTFCFYLVR